MSYADPHAWLLIEAAAMLFVGVLVFRVHGLPRALGGTRAASGPAADAEASLRWLDQYSFIGMGLATLGGLLLIAYLLTAR